MIEIEQIADERVNWAHQRQLTMVAVLAGLVIGAIEILNLTGLFFLVIYIIVALFATVSFYYLFIFEQEIFRWQYKLQKINPEWNIKFEESLFYHFFDCKNPAISMKKERVFGLSAMVFLLFLVIYLGKNYTSLANSSASYPLDVTTLIAFILGIISAFVVFIFQDSYTRKKDREVETEKTRNALKIELSQNAKFAQQSFHAPLSTEAWNQAIQNGQALHFDDDLLEELLNLYSMINDKNNLGKAYLSNPDLKIADDTGQNLVPITNVIGKLTEKIVKEIPNVNKRL
jgi:uncharacterized integral membrane protein